MRYTHDFNFVFSVQSDFLNPDFISPEIIVDRFLGTVRNMDRQEIFERSECFNSFEEETTAMEKVDSEDGGLNRQKFYDSLWQLVKDTDINFEEVLDDGENGVVVRFTGEKQ